MLLLLYFVSSIAKDPPVTKPWHHSHSPSEKYQKAYSFCLTVSQTNFSSTCPSFKHTVHTQYFKLILFTKKELIKKETGKTFTNQGHNEVLSNRDSTHDMKHILKDRFSANQLQETSDRKIIFTACLYYVP